MATQATQVGNTVVVTNVPSLENKSRALVDSQSAVLAAVGIGVVNTLTFLFRGATLAATRMAPFSLVTLKMVILSSTALTIGQIAGALFSTWFLIYNFSMREEPLDAKHQVGVALAAVNSLGNAAFIGSMLFPESIAFGAIEPLFDAATIAGDLLCLGATSLFAGEFFKTS